MCRALMLAAAAAALALFAAALLRNEGQPAGGDRLPPGDAGTCCARTRSGARCTRAAEPGSDRCWQHG